MLSGEKKAEYRKPTDWIKSRLFNKDGSLKSINTVEFTNGYGNHLPKFEVSFEGILIADKHETITFSNGLKVEIEPGDLILRLGEILRIENIFEQ
jgi:hypothetical protein